jgi:hypothetical protein
MFDDCVRCPHCLKTHVLEGLEKNTEYQCWAGEDNSVECPDCSKYFNVQTFYKTHKIEVPEEIGYWVRCFLRRFGEGNFKFPPSYKEEMTQPEFDACDKAFDFAEKIWNKVRDNCNER